MAFDTPFDWFKQNASRLGGINQNMVGVVDGADQDKGRCASSSCIVIDVVPTILEAAA